MKYLKKFNQVNESNGDIILAVRSGDINQVKKLIEAGCDIDKQDSDGETALIWASALFHEGNREKMVKLLIEAGCDIDKQDNDGETALMLASHMGHMEVAKLLIKAGADIDKQSYFKETALIMASQGLTYTQSSQSEMVKILIGSGCDLDKQNNDGETALILASKNNNIEVVKLLLENFADEFIITNRGKSFYDFLNYENKKIIKELYPNEVENGIFASDK